MSIQYPALGFEHMTFRLWVSSHNRSTWAPTICRCYLGTLYLRVDNQSHTSMDDQSHTSMVNQSHTSMDDQMGNLNG